ncbi:MAG: hypothetical protein ABMA14_15850 [Hyphomonadaceae bacterium]
MRPAQDERSGWVGAYQLMMSGGAERRVRRTMSGKGIAEINACALRDAADVFEDRGFRIGIEARDGEEAAVHVEGRARAWAAIVGGRFG